MLAGVRPEEVADVEREGPVEPVAALHARRVAPTRRPRRSSARSRRRKRVAARGGHAVVLIDTLDGLPPPRRAPRARGGPRIVDGGSLTVIAASTLPVGGETTVVALDAALTGAGRFPALDLAAQRHAAPRAARRRRRAREAIAAGARARRCDQRGDVGDPAPGGLGRQLDGWPPRSGWT